MLLFKSFHIIDNIVVVSIELVDTEMLVIADILIPSIITPIEKVDALASP